MGQCDEEVRVPHYRLYKPPAPEPQEYEKKIKFTLRMMDDDCADRVSRDRTLKRWTFIRPE